MTDDTITIPRAEYEGMLDRLQDLEDIAAGNARRHESRLSADGVDLLADGAHPVTVWRKERGLSQRALGQAAGVSSPMLNEIEKRKREPSITTLKALALALDVEPGDLIED